MSPDELPQELINAVKGELKTHLQGISTTFYKEHLEYARAMGVLEGLRKAMAAMDDVVVRYKKSLGE
jgi:hypothetical protein